MRGFKRLIAQSLIMIPRKGSNVENRVIENAPGANLQTFKKKVVTYI